MRRLFSKNIIYLFIFFLVWSSLYFLSCRRDTIKRELPEHPEHTEDLGDMQNRAKEEEIKYFFPIGWYVLYMEDLDIDDYLPDGYLLYPEDIRDKEHIVDSKGEIVDVKSLLKSAEKVVVDGAPMLKIKTNIEEYEVIEEFYHIVGGPSSPRKYYCTKKRAKALPEDLILDDNFVVRLYDKNDKVISEYKMRNEVHPIDYKKDPLAAQNKLEYYGTTHANLIGMLELPPKGQREGLKYRVVRLDSKGKPKPYLYEGAKKPYQYYLWEEALVPYSEYKNWYYSEESGCYSYSQ